MKDVQLSKRLHTVASFIPTGATFADIGSDHAYLPCYVCIHDQKAQAIAGEVNEGPYQLAKDQVNRLQLSERIDVRKGDGLSVLASGEVEVIIIAGMGGGLITSILQEGIKKLGAVQKLILQPNIGAEIVRKWLHEHHWFLRAECILEEDGKIYEILVAVPGEDSHLYKENKDQKIVMGPYLLHEKSDVFIKKWEHELIHLKRILHNLQRATPSAQLRKKRDTLLNKIHLVEEGLR